MKARRLMIVAATGALALTAASLAQASNSDRDGDHMPDRWERAHGLSPRVNDAARDRDRDGLTNLAEYRSGTDPRKSDSDRDGLSNLAEYRAGTNPRSADSDHDGVRDGREDADHDGVRNDREHYDDTEGHSDDS